MGRFKGFSERAVSGFFFSVGRFSEVQKSLQALFISILLLCQTLKFSVKALSHPGHPNVAGLSWGFFSSTEGALFFRISRISSVGPT